MRNNPGCGFLEHGVRRRNDVKDVAMCANRQSPSATSIHCVAARESSDRGGNRAAAILVNRSGCNVASRTIRREAAYIRDCDSRQAARCV